MLAMASSARDREPSLPGEGRGRELRCARTAPGRPDRAEVEAFIRAVYRERYGADVNQFAPVLVSLADEHGDVIAAAGYRAGDRGPLFLEQYLAAPIETYLVQEPSALPERSRLVEVGHLAADARGRRPAPDPAARAAPGGARLPVGDRHPDAGTAAPVPAPGRRAALARRSRSRRFSAPRSRAGAATTTTARWCWPAGSTWRCRPSRAGARCHEAGAARRPRGPGARSDLARRDEKRRRGCLRQTGARVLATAHGQRAGLRRARRSGERRRLRSCAAAALLHAGADAARAVATAGVDTLLVDPALAALWPALRWDAVAVAGRVAAVRSPATRSRSTLPAGHRQDHLHLRHHRRAQGRVPERHRPCSRWPRGLVQALAPLDIERHLCALPFAVLLENIAGLMAPLLRGATLHRRCRWPSSGLSGSSSFDAARFHAAVQRASSRTA